MIKTQWSFNLNHMCELGLSYVCEILRKMQNAWQMEMLEQAELGRRTKHGSIAKK